MHVFLKLIFQAGILKFSSERNVFLNFFIKFILSAKLQVLFIMQANLVPPLDQINYSIV